MPPGVLKKPPDIFEEESNAQCAGHNDLHEVTACPGVDI